MNHVHCLILMCLQHVWPSGPLRMSSVLCKWKYEWVTHTTACHYYTH